MVEFAESEWMKRTSPNGITALGRRWRGMAGGGRPPSSALASRALGVAASPKTGSRRSPWSPRPSRWRGRGRHRPPAVACGGEGGRTRFRCVTALATPWRGRNNKNKRMCLCEKEIWLSRFSGSQFCSFGV